MSKLANVLMSKLANWLMSKLVNDRIGKLGNELMNILSNHHIKKMRFIKLLLLFIIFSVYNFSYSQYMLGLRGGGGVSDLTGSDFSKVSTYKLGIDLAFFYEREINPTISIATELNFNQKGSDYEFYPRELTTVFVDIRSEYINIPIIVKAYFGKKQSLYFYGGLAYAKLLSHNLSHYAKEGDYEVSSELFCPYSINSSDALLNVGFGFYMYNILLDFRYQHSLSSIYKGVDAPSIRNHYVGVTIGYTLYKKKVIRCMGGRLR